MKLTALVCGVAVTALVGLGQAQAADLLYSQPAPAMAQSKGGPYFGVKAGANFQDDIDGNLDGDADVADTLETDTGFNASIVAGYAFGSRWGILAPRLEVEAGYMNNDADQSAVDAGVLAATDGEVNAFYWFANLLLDIPMGWGFTPFIGAGAGFANVRFDNVSATAGPIDTFNGEDTAFAWNVTAGLSYDISRNVTVDVAYRFVQFNDVDAFNATAGAVVSGDIDNHQVNVGLRVHL
ncbi:MAG: outer membrane beta-barrel protein [Pseudomonadota bacterium]